MRLFALSICLTASCAATGAEFLGRPETPIGWPDADAARISLEFVYAGTADAHPARSTGERLSNFLFGQTELRLISPYGIAWSPGDVLFIADSGQSVVHRLDLALGEHELLALPPEASLDTPIGVAAAPDGRIFVSDSVRARIHVFDAAGEHLYSFGDAASLGRPTGLAFSPGRGSLYVCDTTGGRVLELGPRGELVSESGGRGTEAGEFNYPTNLVVAPDGSLWITDSLNFRIQHLDAELQPLSAFGLAGSGPGTFAKPKGIALDPDGHIYVVDGMFDNVQLFQPDGQLLLAVGSQGNAPGQFYLPTGIASAPDGRLFVSDSGNGRIQVLRYHPQD